MDNMSVADRRRTMASIRSKDTDIELVLRKVLWRAGLRYRLHSKLPGRPDIVFPGRRVAVFCDGCFWHGCPKCALTPKQNRRYWSDKISGNRLRDLRITDALEGAGWVVLRFWGCEIKSDVESVVREIREAVGK